MFYLLSFCTKFGRSGHDDRLHFRTRCGAGKGANKIELFWPGCCGSLARWPGEVKEAEGELKLKVAESEETIAGAIRENRDGGHDTNAPQPPRRARCPLDTEADDTADEADELLDDLWDGETKRFTLCCKIGARCGGHSST